MSLWPGGDSDSEPEENEQKPAARGNSELHLERGCSDLYEDDEDSEAAPMYDWWTQNTLSLNLWIFESIFIKIPFHSISIRI